MSYRWGGPELWRTTTGKKRYSVGYRKETTNFLGRPKTRIHWLYDGYDRSTAREIYLWAVSKGIDVKCYDGEELDRIIDLLS